MAKKPSPSPKKNDPSFPGLKPTGKSTPAQKSQYEERQQDEVTALKAIYTEDFEEHKAAHSAWKVSLSSPNPRITASPYSHKSRPQEIRAFI